MPPTIVDAVFWAAVACCAVAQWFILRGAFAQPGAAKPGSAVPAARRPAEIAWAVIPAVALALVLAATWRSLHPASPAASHDHSEATVADPEHGA